MNLYSLILTSVIFLGFFISKKRSKIYQIPSHHIDSLFFLTIPLAIIGARLYHVIDKWDFYSKNFLQIFMVWQGGLGIFGALFGGFIGILIYWLSQKKNLSFSILLDLIAPSVLFGQALGRLGNFFNQEAFGPPTSLPWGVYIDLSKRPEQWRGFAHFHPTFFYELIWDLLGALILFSLQNKLKKKPLFTTALYLIIYGTGRFLVEFFRFDTFQIGQIKVAQVLSLALIILGLGLTKKIFWANLFK